MTQYEREQIVKALECCTSSNKSADCPIGCPWGDMKSCEENLMYHALALIRELIEDNEAKNETITNLIANIKDIQADTVRKMQEAIRKRCIEGGIYPAFVARVVEKVAEDIIGGQTDEG